MPLVDEAIMHETFWPSFRELHSGTQCLQVERTPFTWCRRKYEQKTTGSSLEKALANGWLANRAWAGLACRELEDTLDQRPSAMPGRPFTVTMATLTNSTMHRRRGLMLKGTRLLGTRSSELIGAEWDETAWNSGLYGPLCSISCYVKAGEYLRKTSGFGAIFGLELFVRLVW